MKESFQDAHRLDDFQLERFAQNGHMSCDTFNGSLQRHMFYYVSQYQALFARARAGSGERAGGARAKKSGVPWALSKKKARKIT